MLLPTSAVVLIALVVGSQAYFFGSSRPAPAWDGLRVGYGFGRMSFDTMPRTVRDAVRTGWTQDNYVTCNGSSTYKGNRYVKGSDTSVMLLFDKNGFIAGVQAGIPKIEGYPGQNKYKAFNEEPDMWVTTAYFVEPAKICSTGRSDEEFAANGTGTMLAIQTGNNANQLMRIPMVETNVTTTTKFVEGKCFYWMGMHYWYNQSVDMSCDNLFPVFLMYNRGKLNAFGWAFKPFFSNPRWEHPSPSQFKMFMKYPPTCLMEQGNLVSSLHVYLTNRPSLNYC